MERSPQVGMMMMEWNAKTPSLWDWDNPMLLGGNPKQQQPAERAICSGSVHSSAVGGDWSASEPGNGSSSKSSIDSSSHAGIGARSFNVEAFPKYCDRSAGSTRVQGTGASPAAAPTQEPLIGLKLGKRTYFEDGCPGNSSVRKPASSSSASSSPSATPTALAKRLRPSHQSTQAFHCQVEGCNIDLTGAKGYHRKHRVCESHSKCPRVIIAGQERRFCQQCSRFHDLSAFDEKKRSCRKRLSDHNARRRKPQPGIISPNSASLSSSFYDDGHQINFLLNKPPFGHMRPSASSTWESSCDFKFTHAKDSWIKSAKRGDIEAQLLLPSTALSNAIPTLPHDLDRFLPFKGVTAEVLNADSINSQKNSHLVSTITSNLNGAPDLRRALSLLSMDAWGSADPSGLTSSLSHPVHPSHTDAAQPAVQATNLASNYWQHEKPPAQQARALPFAMNSDGSQFQEFQLLKAPYYDTTFFDSSRIH